ncbi:gamma-glutamylcyclotransferase family protein [Actinomadura parmotrematis]|uniref:Putative gamma-glutamylcyclotransferase n=1 Tax=Actinomadura parmotrematis TaxID=2864039 RepID=A0ABS7FNS6_9ACTN|nr:gamma-glutamylcyclotransferase family protein [Actinomadura parmotrematis]MBW8482029.1 gamma-glutamylcyclotransferase [Actinomadura parmotrematis]
MSDEEPSDGLFAYGTLRFPEVLEMLLGRVPEMAPARAAGWRVRALPGVVYPGLVADPSGVAEGVLISGLDAAETRLLDAYEDAEYDVAVLPLDGGRRGRAYLWRGAAEPFDWDAARFAERELRRFVDSVRPWRLAFE